MMGLRQIATRKTAYFGQSCESGVDLTKPPSPAARQKAETKRKQTRDSGQHPLAVSAKGYASEAGAWFREFTQMITERGRPLDHEHAQQFEEASQVVQWYQYQIAVKLMRAVSSRQEENEEPGESVQKDSDGSAKVALIGIDRSIGAWRMLQLAVPEKAVWVIRMILQLEYLRREIESEFPDAREFVRPGFDEVLGQPN
jgi:hypothetical protein